MQAADGEDVALVMVAKHSGSGASKTRLTRQLAAAAATSGSPPTDEQLSVAQAQSSAFTRAAIKDLVQRFSDRNLHCKRVLLYAPPHDDARAYFHDLLSEMRAVPAAGAAAPSAWTLMPVMAKADPRASDLGSLLADATDRVRTATQCTRVAFMGSDCPELSLEAVQRAIAISRETGVASLCPASDGGYTFLALPAEAEATRAFAAVHWSASDTALSQLAALSRAGLRCDVGQTFMDVDELEDLHALAARLQASRRTAEDCPFTSALCAELRQAGHIRVECATEQ